MNKLQTAKQLLETHQWSLERHIKELERAKTEFIGERLEREIKSETEYNERNPVYIEALEMLIEDYEMKDRQGRDHDIDEARAEEMEQERLADNAQEHAQEMLAEEQRERSAIIKLNKK